MQKQPKIQIGNRLLTVNKNVTEMFDANKAYKAKDFKQMREKLEDEGYLFIRGVISKQKMSNARHMISSQANKNNDDSCVLTR